MQRVTQVSPELTKSYLRPQETRIQPHPRPKGTPNPKQRPCRCPYHLWSQILIRINLKSMEGE